MAALQVGIIGMGGFAGQHHDAFAELEAQGECRLVCTCDPKMADFTERQEALRFADRGVRTFLDYRDMLAACADELDVVTIPTPVPLHAEMHRAFVERGLPVYLEKPPTLNYAELDAMLEVEAQAQRETNVGFNYIVEPPRQALKRRLLAGEFGALRQVQFHGFAPRPASYYARAPWAARLWMDGRLVLDSPLGNAMAHFAHNVLFWCGTRDLFAWGELTRVQAELYRAHAIEGMDTVFLAAQTADGPHLQIAMTHASTQGFFREYLQCDAATIAYSPWPETGLPFYPYQIRWRDGRVENGAWPEGPATLAMNLQHYLRYLRGEEPRPLNRLVDSRPFVQLNDLAYLAAGTIGTVPESAFRREQINGQDFVDITGIGEMAARFLATGDFPSAQGVAWALPTGTATPADLPRLEAVVQGMLAE